MRHKDVPSYDAEGDPNKLDLIRMHLPADSPKSENVSVPLGLIAPTPENSWDRHTCFPQVGLV